MEWNKEEESNREKVDGCLVLNVEESIIETVDGSMVSDVGMEDEDTKNRLMFCWNPSSRPGT